MKASENTPELPPFPAFPCISRYVSVGSTVDALDRVRRSIKSCDGVSLVIGPPGTGKSLVCRILADEFKESHDVVLFGDAPIDDQADFHRHLLHQLDVDIESIVDGDLHLALIDRVCGKHAAEGGLLIIVDEAQILSTDVLEAIRMVTNIMSDDQPRVTAVVCGGVKLDDTLTSPILDAFTQRVSTRCYLHPMNAAETREYIHGAIEACQSNPDDTISDEAVGAIHHACSGVPRLINQIMTEAIDCAAENDQDLICERMIDLAWAQLQQLPSPMVEEPKIAHNTNPVEFGALSDLSAPNPSETAPSEVATSETAPSEVATSEVATIETVPSSIDEDQRCCDSTTECVAEACDANGTIEWAEESEDLGSLEVTPESIRDVQPVAPLPSELFGEFEMEETVPVGDGVRATTTLNNNEPSTELETMIHSEIVSLSELAADARAGCTEAEARDIMSQDDQPQPVLWIAEPDSVQGKETIEPADDIVLTGNCAADDSDLLVIEDDITVQPQAGTTRVDDRQQKVTVDFHAMLNSMRKTT